MPIIVERRAELTSGRELVWSALADTERMNRAVGLGPLRVTPNEDSSAARYVLSTVSGGFPLQYEERPFEFVENERFRVSRVMRGGLLRRLTNEFELATLADGKTSVLVRLTVEPRFKALGPVARFQLGRFADRITSELRQFDADASAGKATCFRTGRSPVDHVALERAASALASTLSGERAELGQKLAEFLREAPDADVLRIRPFELAARFEADPREMLAVCLHAVKAGLLELAWELVCPSCRTGSDSAKALADLPTTGHCHMCDLSFELELDRAVEATFHPAASLRSVDPGPYCIGGPRRTPHVVSQAIVPAQGEVQLFAPREPGRYRLFLRGNAVSALTVEAEGAPIVNFQATDSTLTPSTSVAAPGAELRISKSGERETHIKLERMTWASHAATAHVVSTLPEFRRDFSSDLLRPGVTLRVARVALLFTDLTDSTALYSRVGDAKAFRVVQEHFDLLLAILSRHHGALVKTIGDAVMAAFVEEGNAVRAAVEMLERFPKFRTTLPEAGRTFLKVGVYAGPCYVVTANGVLDYFGQTVNTAARLQAAAGAGEIIVTEALAEEASERGWLQGRALGARFEANLKGLAGPVRVVRVPIDVPDA